MAAKKAAKKATRKTTAKKAAKAPAKKAAPKPAAGAGDASAEIEARFEGLGDWRGESLLRMRALIKRAVPDVVEEVKWRKPTNPDGVAVWSHHGMICTGEVYQEHVKLTFPHGSSLKDPRKVFNAGLGGVRRAIDLREGDAVDEEAFVDVVRDAAALNEAASARRG